MITVEEFDALCAKYIEKKDYEDKCKKRLDEIKENTKAVETELLAAFEELDKTENEGSFGKIKITQREYYKMADKEQVFNWLKERGEFEHLATVNAQTFSGHCKALVQEKRADNDFVWLPPGVVDSTSDYTKLKIVNKGAK